MTNLEFFEKLAEKKTQKLQQYGHSDKYEVIVSSSDYLIAVIKYTMKYSVSYQICTIDIDTSHLILVRTFVNKESAMNAFKAFTAPY